ncbi:MAG: hypothetical protein M3Y48_08230 [Actinomycetota bacterium]|nr:hypothetical protein [Actinomycetota bacterium]
MAGTFGADPQVAGQMSGDLGGIRSAMTSMGQTFDQYGGATGSSHVEGALQDFFSKSSDNRKNMDGLLQQASGLLGGLAQGTTSVDTSLRDSLESKGDPPQETITVPAAGNAQ